MSTLMALEGVDAIFMPHASPRGSPLEKTESWLRHLPSRAFDNGIYVIACNQSSETQEGLSFPGVVLALSPSGRAFAKYSGSAQELVLVELRESELEEVRGSRMKYFLPRRRPELYKDIAKPMRLNRVARGVRPKNKRHREDLLLCP
jgi:N-carbamoylputrescine amidase